MNPNKQLAPHILLYALGYYAFVALMFIIGFILALIIILLMIIGIRTALILAVFVIIPLTRYTISFLTILINGVHLNSNKYVEIELRKQDEADIFQIIEELKSHIHIKSKVKVVICYADSWMPLNDLLFTNGTIRLRISTGDFAVLSVDEIKPLLALQLAYAEYAERGINGYALRAIMRIHQLLEMIDSNAPKEKGEIHFGKIVKPALLYFRYHLLGRYIVYSKYYEEKADSIVSDICGDDLYNLMILKTNITNHINGQIYAKEHIMALNNHYDYWLWLKSKLAPDNLEIVDVIKGMLLYTNISSEYRAGNVITERIRMAAVDHTETQNIVPSYTLLSNPEGMVSRLVNKLIQSVKKHESLDSKEITVKSGNVRISDCSIAQGFGVVFLLLSIVGIVVLISNIHQSGFSDFFAINGFVIFAIFIGAVPGLYFIKSGSTNKTEIPIPEYVTWIGKNKNTSTIAEFCGKVNGIQHKLKKEYSPSKTNACKLLDTGLNALRNCDYKKANAAADLALQYMHNLQGALFVKLISSHPSNQFESGKLLNLVYKSGRSNKLYFWIMAWAGLNLGYQEFAEKNLILALRKNSKLLALYPYLAYIRYNRMKFFSAEEDIVKGIEGGCKSAECMLLYADILRSVGKPKDAIIVLEEINPSDIDRKDLMHRLMLVKLLAGFNDESYTLAKQLSEMYPDSETFMKIAHDFISASALDQAEEFYLKTFDQSPSPDPLIGLGQVEYHRYKFSAARDRLYQALGLLNNPEIEPLDAATTLNNILMGLMAFDKPVDTCHVWTVDIEALESDILFRDQQVMIFAMNTTDAEKYARKILSAIYPDLDKEIVKFKNWMQMSKTSETRVPGVAEWRLNPVILKMEGPVSQPEDSSVD